MLSCVAVSASSPLEAADCTLVRMGDRSMPIPHSRDTISVVFVTNRLRYSQLSVSPCVVRFRMKYWLNHSRRLQREKTHEGRWHSVRNAVRVGLLPRFQRLQLQWRRAPRQPLFPTPTEPIVAEAFLPDLGLRQGDIGHRSVSDCELSHLLRAGRQWDARGCTNRSDKRACERAQLLRRESVRGGRCLVR